MDLSALLANCPSPSLQSPSTAPSLPSAALWPSALYEQICQLANADQWSFLDTPFPVAHLGVSQHYLVVCPPHRREKNAQKPHFLMGSALSANPRPKWTPLRVNADAVAINGRHCPQ